MAKLHSSKKAIVKNGSSGHQVEHHETFDDNLLPDAAEIEKYQKLDPEIMSWLKARAEKEQDFRHKAFNDKFYCFYLEHSLFTYIFTM